MAANWFAQVGNTEVGPLSSTQLRDLAESKRITPSTLIRQGQLGNWHPASQVKGLFQIGTGSVISPAKPQNDGADVDFDEMISSALESPLQTSVAQPSALLQDSSSSLGSEVSTNERHNERIRDTESTTADIDNRPVPQTPRMKSRELNQEFIPRPSQRTVETIAFATFRYAVVSLAAIVIAVMLYSAVLLLTNRGTMPYSYRPTLAYPEAKKRAGDTLEKERREEVNATKDNEDAQWRNFVFVEIDGRQLSVPRRLVAAFSEASFFRIQLSIHLTQIPKEYEAETTVALEAFLRQIDEDKNLTDVRLARQMIDDYAREITTKSLEIYRHNLRRAQNQNAAWTALNTSIPLLVASLLVLVLLAIERNTRSWRA